jgi:predicted extracellular nuclease
MSTRALEALSRLSLALSLISLSPATAPGDAGRCGDPSVRIHQIQGPGASSPLRHDGLVVEAVVVAAFPGLPDGLGGFFLQQPDRETDGDPLTSEGLFVFDAGNAARVRAGERVRVAGEVREFFGLTELALESAVVHCGRSRLPSAALRPLPVASGESWERYEGMRVRIEDELVVTDLFGLARFGELGLAAGDRPRAPTQQAAPGAAALAVAQHNARHSILLDDGSSLRNPEPIPYLDMPDGGSLRAGDRAGAIEGVVDFAFGRFRIQPTRPVELQRATARRPQPPDVGGTLRVAAWNVENHFNGDATRPAGGFPTRGAANERELERQRAKLVETLARLDADVLGLVELENDGIAADSSAATLLSELARQTGTEYALIDPGPGALGSHAIAVALAYRPEAVVPIGVPAVLDASAHPAYDSELNRPGLAASFRHRASGERFTLVVNHWKSKGSSCAAAGDPDRGDGQSRCSATRSGAARALAEWIATDPTAAGSPPALLVGDLNAYPREDPLVLLEQAGFVDLLAAFAGPDAYTFVFAGQVGRLDHALASPGLLHELAGAAVWHTNADEAAALDYREENPPDRYRPDPFRASDHDPLLLGLFPDRDTDGVLDSRDACPDSPRHPTIRFGDCDSGVAERIDATGCSLAERLEAGSLPLAEAAAQARDRTALVRCAARTGRQALIRPGRGRASWSRSPR